MSLVQTVVDRIRNLTLPSEIPVSLELITPLPDDEALTLIELTGEEKLNDCFVFDLTCVAPEFGLDFQKLIGEEVSIIFRYGDQDTQMRYIHGIIGEIRQGATNVDDLDRKAVTKPKKLRVTQTLNGERVEKEVTIHAPETMLYLKVYPALWTTKFSKNFKIFQEKSTLEIVEQVLSNHKIIKHIKYNNTSYGEEKREYCVQYDESDYDFVTRILAEDGLFFYHEHTDTEHLLVIADAPSTHKELEEPQRIQTQQFRPKTPLPNHIQAIELCKQTAIKHFATTDYNYESPHTDLFTLEGDEADRNAATRRHYYYPGRFRDEKSGQYNARNKREAEAWQENLVQGRSTVFAFQAGKAFRLEDHIRADANKKYVLHTVKHEMTINPKKGQLTYQNAFIAFAYEHPFRPNPVHKKPKILSTQTAIVTGDKDEEIWTDDYGRIKVQFHWDQDGQRNEETTCWLRVQQVWAGDNWGFMFVPRIGMEVVVSFIDGDPDRPLVTGCVYNKANMPPSVSIDPKRSTIRTRSTKMDDWNKEGSDTADVRFHELTFDDTINTERVYLRSSYNYNVDVQNKKTLDIHDSHNLTTLHAAKGSNANYVTTLKQGNRIVSLNKGHHLHSLLKGDMMQILKQGHKSEIISEGDRLVALTKGSALHTIGGHYGMICSQIGILSGGISLTATRQGGEGGNLEASEAGIYGDQSSLLDGRSHEDRYTGNELPLITPPENPGNTADPSKVNINIDKLDVDTTITNADMRLKLTGNRESQISGNETAKIGGNVTQTIEGDYALKVAGNLSLQVGGNITISASNITIKSSQAAAVEAGTSLDLSATTALSASGLAVEIVADTTLTASGTAQAAISGGGSLKLSGGAVQIN